MKGEITHALEDALDLRKKLIADGTPVAEANHIVGQGLKAVLGNTREAPWRFYCEHCRDTGWVNVLPSAEEVERLTRMYGWADKTMWYVVKCEPCKWMQMEREKRRQKAGHESEDDFAAAGQVKKRRTFTKFGG